jgi:hypothetical protein
MPLARGLPSTASQRPEPQLSAARMAVSVSQRVRPEDHFVRAYVIAS